MENIKMILNKEKRTIDVTYKIKNKKSDDAIFNAITDIVRQNKLDCNFGEDSNGLRYIHMSSTKIDDVTKTYSYIEKLN